MTARDFLAEQLDELRAPISSPSTVVSWPGLPQVDLAADIDLGGTPC
jgi:hypothetical protein